MVSLDHNNEIIEKLVKEKKFDKYILFKLFLKSPLSPVDFFNLPNISYDPLKINRNTFFTKIKPLVEPPDKSKRPLVQIHYKQKNSFYSISDEGKAELIKNAKEYGFDYERTLKIEVDQLNRSKKEMDILFSKLELHDERYKFEYLELKNDIEYEHFSSFLTPAQFDLCILYIALNHPQFYHENPEFKSETKSMPDFVKWIKNRMSNKEDIVEEHQIRLFLDKILKLDISYQIELDCDDECLYFRKKSEYGQLFEIIIKSKIKEHYLGTHSQYHFSFDEDSITEISSILCHKLELLDEGIKDYLKDTIKNYINQLIHEVDNYPKILSSKDRTNLFQIASGARMLQSEQSEPKELKVGFFNLGKILTSDKWKTEQYQEKNSKLIQNIILKNAEYKYELKHQRLNLLEDLIVQSYLNYRNLRTNEALNNAETLIKYFPKKYVGYYLKSRFLLDPKKLKENIRDTEVNLDKFPRNRFFEDFYLIYLMLFDDTTKIIAYFQNTFNYDIESIPICYFCIEYLLNSNKYQEVIQISNNLFRLKIPNRMKEELIEYLLPLYFRTIQDVDVLHDTILKFCNSNGYNFNLYQYDELKKNLDMKFYDQKQKNNLFLQKILNRMPDLIYKKHSELLNLVKENNDTNNLKEKLKDTQEKLKKGEDQNCFDIAMESAILEYQYGDKVFGLKTIDEIIETKITQDFLSNDAKGFFEQCLNIAYSLSNASLVDKIEKFGKNIHDIIETRKNLGLLDILTYIYQISGNFQKEIAIYNILIEYEMKHNPPWAKYTITRAIERILNRKGSQEAFQWIKSFKNRIDNFCLWLYDYLYAIILITDNQFDFAFEIIKKYLLLCPLDYVCLEILANFLCISAYLHYKRGQIFNVFDDLINVDEFLKKHKNVTAFGDLRPPIFFRNYEELLSNWDFIINDGYFLFLKDNLTALLDIPHPKEKSNGTEEE